MGADAQSSARATVEEPVSPPMARSMQASISRSRRVMKDYRFLTSTEAGEVLGSRSGSRSLASHHRLEGKLVGVRDGTRVLYPEFQFDEAGHVYPVIPKLISLAKSHDWSEPSVVLWLVTPTGYFDDKPPVQCLNDLDRILAGASSGFNTSW